MNYGFPDWMFAGIAIAAYELANLLARWLGAPGIRWAGYGVIAACAAIVGVRWLRRLWAKREDRRPPKDE